MNFRNTTGYDSATIQKLIRIAVREVQGAMPHLSDVIPLWAEKRADRILHLCEVWVRARNIGCDCSGRAWRDGSKMVLSLGPGLSTVQVLWLIRHEVLHLFGLRHPAFPDAVRWRSDAAYQAIRDIFAADLAKLPTDLPLAREPVIVVEPELSKVQITQAKLDRVMAREKAWTSKLSRATKALAKLKRSRSALERSLAKATETEATT